MRTYSDDFSAELARHAIEHGDRATARAYDVPRMTVYHKRVKFQQAGGTFKRAKGPDYTDEEKEVIRKYSSDVNSGKMTYGDLAKIVSEVGVWQRESRGVWCVMNKMGLRTGGRTRQNIEARYFKPFKSVDERDDYFARLDEEEQQRKMEVYDPFFHVLDPRAEAVIDGMLGDLVSRLERGDGPRVYGKLMEVA
jgi:hypothetical protein